MGVKSQYGQMGVYNSTLVDVEDGGSRGIAVDSKGRIILTPSSIGSGGGAIAATTVGHGNKSVTTAGTDVVLAASTTCISVTITANETNTGVIAVGGSGVDATSATRTGAYLFPGDSITLAIGNLNAIYIDSTVSGEGVSYTYTA